jgi:signal transduction histidine kinase
MVSESHRGEVLGGDASEQERSASARVAEHGAAHVLDVLELGVLVLARDLHVSYANARWESWLGARVSAGAPLVSLLDDEAAPVEEELRVVLMDGESRTMTLTLRGGRADTVTRRLVCTVHRVGDGLVVEARLDGDDEHATMNDIARRLAEATDMAEVLRTLCDIAIRQCSASGAAVLRVLGHQGEVVAAAGDLVPARGRFFELDGSLLMEAITEHEIVSEENYHESGRPLMRVAPELALGPMLVAPLRAHGETLGVIAIARGMGGRAFRAREIERLRVLADHAALAVHKSLLLMQAQSADKAKGRFLATMSHELRTPLTALAGYNELLIDQVIGPVSDPQLDILERMRSVTIHLSAMIEEILAFTSLEEGREIVRPTEFLAADLVRAAIAVVQPLADQKKLKIEVSLPRNFIRMTSDIDKSQQILVNLLGNAVKFTDTGTVSVVLSVRGAAVWIDVQDSGIGIPEEELMRLFRPFAQVDSGLTRQHGGTGLGLYISRRLAMLLGGHIEVFSEPGVGSRFSVILPLVWEGPV